MPGMTVAHIQAGQILWLLPKEDLEIDIGLEDGCYNHPVVVLSPGLSNRKVVILILTSFNGVDLSIKHANNKTARLAHLPIEPCSPHPDNHILLSLKRNLFLHKNSYVKTENQHTLSSSVLRSYDNSGKIFVLKNDSYQKLINHAKFIPATSPALDLLPHNQDRLLRPSLWTSQSVAGLSAPQLNSHYNENSQPRYLEDEERGLYRGSSYGTIQNTPYTQHDTGRIHGNFMPHNSRFARRSEPSPWSNPGSGGDNDRRISLGVAVLILILCTAIFGAGSYGLFWVSMQAIKVMKGVANSAWDWIKDFLGGSLKKPKSWVTDSIMMLF